MSTPRLTINAWFQSVTRNPSTHRKQTENRNVTGILVDGFEWPRDWSLIYQRIATHTPTDAPGSWRLEGFYVVSQSMV